MLHHGPSCSIMFRHVASWSIIFHHHHHHHRNHHDHNLHSHAPRPPCPPPLTPPHQHHHRINTWPFRIKNPRSQVMPGKSFPEAPTYGKLEEGARLCGSPVTLQAARPSVTGAEVYCLERPGCNGVPARRFGQRGWYRCYHACHVVHIALIRRYIVTYHDIS